MELDWSWNKARLELDWSWTGAGLELDWSQTGAATSCPAVLFCYVQSSRTLVPVGFPWVFKALEGPGKSLGKKQ